MGKQGNKKLKEKKRHPKRSARVIARCIYHDLEFSLARKDIRYAVCYKCEQETRPSYLEFEDEI